MFITHYTNEMILKRRTVDESKLPQVEESATMRKNLLLVRLQNNEQNCKLEFGKPELL